MTPDQAVQLLRGVQILVFLVVFLIWMLFMMFVFGRGKK
jgi:hypothetical protein